jgi:succinylglutamate desuccinylase
MFEKVITLQGKEKGPTSMILAGVHGNEICGVEAFKNMLPNLKIDKGRVYFAYGNPRAIKAKKRFMETDLNRMFKKNTSLSANDKKSYEYARAKILKKYLNQASALLDIHSSRNAKSKVFTICEANSFGITKYLPVGLVVSGFDKVQPGGTDYYMNRIGKMGICIECGQTNDPQSVIRAQNAIIGFLKARGHIANNLKPKKQSYMNIYHMYMTKTSVFTLKKSFKDFEKVSKGQIIGTDGNITVRSKKDSVILFSGNENEPGQEAFLLAQEKRGE